MIPRIFHQTWKDARVPAAFRAFQSSWLEHNPEWEYRFWTDGSARRFVAEHYGSLLDLYDGYDLAIKRVDMVRYLWMHRVGGVYADLDFECLKPLESTLAGSRLVLGVEPDEHVQPWIGEHGLDALVCNAFIASEPGHPFWEHVFTRLGDWRHHDPVSATGPLFLSHALASYPRPHEVTVLPASVLYPVEKEATWAARGESSRLRLPAEAVAVHHFVGTWWRDGALAAAESPTDGPRILVATPIKNACRHLPGYFENLRRITYPHRRVSLAFLESDSDDGSWEELRRQIDGLHGFRRVEAHKHDHGYRFDGPRWAREIQARRRSILARSRNRLLGALRDEDWVLWLDADVVDYPTDVIERLLDTGEDIVVPHCLGPDGRTFDLNTFQLHDDAHERDWSAHVFDGLLQPPRGEGRRYLEDLREHTIVPVDSVGGTMLLVRADLHREGLCFPSMPYKQYIETEGLAMMARDMGHRCWGLPQLEIFHA